MPPAWRGREWEGWDSRLYLAILGLSWSHMNFRMLFFFFFDSVKKATVILIGSELNPYIALSSLDIFSPTADILILLLIHAQGMFFHFLRPWWFLSSVFYNFHCRGSFTTLNLFLRIWFSVVTVNVFSSLAASSSLADAKQTARIQICLEFVTEGHQEKVALPWTAAGSAPTHLSPQTCPHLTQHTVLHPWRTGPISQ